MGKTNIPNKLNHKLQANARVYEENEKETKNDCGLKYFVVKGSTLKGCRSTVMRQIQVKFTTKILHSIKVIVQ